MRRNLILSLELGFTTLGVDAVFVLCSDFVQVGLQGSAERWAPGCVNAAGKARQKW